MEGLRLKGKLPTFSPTVQLSFASYNIHKAVGLDRRRDPDRILAILREIDADVVALQEADRRLGRRASVLPLAAIHEHTHYRPVPLSMRPDSIGWHGNALLVKRGIELVESSVVPLPVLEPRGAIRADLIANGRRIRVVAMHLDLSGLRRRQQVRMILSHLADCAEPCPSVLMGDLNEWGSQAGCLREFGRDWHVLAPGRSFPSRRPVAELDRIIVSPEWEVLTAQVHHSALAARGSDHLPVWAELELSPPGVTAVRRVMSAAPAGAGRFLAAGRPALARLTKAATYRRLARRLVEARRGE